jgi:hypothetical protein
MKREHIVISILFMLLLIIPVLAAFLNIKIQNSAADNFINAKFVSWEELEPGQEGIGLTVLKGTEPEKFYVKFDGVISHPLFPKEKLILVRIGYPFEKSNVVAGLSGSPIYFKRNNEWRLAGALAYGIGELSNEKALGGVTPIKAMLDQEKLNLHTAKQNGSEIKKYCGYEIKPLDLQITPLNNRGGSNSRIEKLRRPKPGEAVAIVLVNGDYEFAATCTVTYVKGDNFWTCGHPLLNEGKTLIPAYKGKIATTFMSPLNAFKLAEKHQELFGFIEYDYLFAVKGKIAKLPEKSLIKTNLTVGIGEDKKAELSFETFKHRDYTQMLIAGISEDFLNNLWPGSEKATVTSKTIINFYDRKPLTLYESSLLNEDFSFGIFRFKSGWPIGNSMAKLYSFMKSDWNFNIQSIDIDIHAEPGEKFLRPDSYALLDKNDKPVDEANLGDELKLVLGLTNSHPKKHFIIAIPIEIPKHLDVKKTISSAKYAMIDIFVESGNNYQERNKNKFNRKPDTAEEFLENLMINEKDHAKLYIQIVLPPTNVKTIPAKWPKLKPEEWNEIKNLNFLRETKSVERKIIIKEINSPQKDYLLDIKLKISLKINLANSSKKP